MKKLVASVLLSMFALIGGTAVAQQFPNKTITIVTSFPAGAAADGYLRKMAEVISRNIGHPVVVENRPGGSGAVALAEYNNSPKDGYTIFFADPTVINGYPLVFGKDDLVRNVKILKPSTNIDLALTVNANVKNIDDLKALLQKQPMYGSWQIGSTSHIWSSQLVDALGVKATHIPYKDFGQWQIDISNAQLAFSLVTFPSSRGLVDAGKNRWLATTGEKRNPMFPDVPTFDEVFGKGKIIGPKTGAAFYIHRAVPENIQAALRKELDKAFADPAVKEALASRTYIQWAVPDKDIESVMARDAEQYRAYLKKFNIDISKK